MLQTGFTGSGSIVYSELCVDITEYQSDIPYFCTIPQQPISVVNRLNSDTWNTKTPAYAGTIGLGGNSPFWQIGMGYYIDFGISMANFNNWTFAQSDWVATYAQSSIGINSPQIDEHYYNLFDNGYYLEAYGYANPANGLVYQSLSIFGFGQNYANGTAYYESLLNSNSTVYGNYTNQS